MYKIQTLNNISKCGLDRLPKDRYEIADKIDAPDAVLLRSAGRRSRPHLEMLLRVWILYMGRVIRVFWRNRP